MRNINRVVKIRIYPNKEQISQIEKTIGCCRFLYNQMLADKISYYQKEKKMLKNTPAGYKKEYPWLKEADSLALANVQRNLEGAFRKFFREPKVGFPNYKSKKFPEILYNKYDKWKYLPAGKVSETTKDDTHKNKTSPFDTGRVETKISDCKQGTNRKIFCKSVVRL